MKVLTSLNHLLQKAHRRLVEFSAARLPFCVEGLQNVH
jgi:hypothetical protein